MLKEILINVTPLEKRVAIICDGRLEEFYIERPEDKTIVGNIYKGQINSIVSSMNAAFVNIGLAKNGFLYLAEALETIEPVELYNMEKKIDVKIGQEILVQVIKEPFGTKGPKLTSHISLPGRYLVLMPFDLQRGVSRRIEDEKERKRLQKILEELNLPKNMGFIVRTEARDKDKHELLRDARFLIKLWQRIKKLASHKKAPSFIYQEYDLALRIVRDSFTKDITRLVVDSREEYKRIWHFVRTFSKDLLRKIELHQLEEPLFEHKKIESQINQIFENKVYLKSGVYIIIEPTEGLVVIDVNSGSFRKKIDPEEMAFRVNSETAREIVHQLRLRDLGGIIVIDFIDMQSQRHRQEVLKILKEGFEEDRANTEILGISKLGLVEMTRERVHRTIESMSYQNCPYCYGKGKIKSIPTIAIRALRELKEILERSAKEKKDKIEVFCHPDVATHILNFNKNNLLVLERRFRTKIQIVPQANLRPEEIKIA